MANPVFFPASDDFLQKVDELKRRLRLRMNGATTEQMEKRNIGYALNYGAQLPHLRQLAETCHFEGEELYQLWKLNIRETMLLACMLSPALSADEALRWVDDVRTPDMAEQASFFLFCRTNEFGCFAAKLVESHAPYAFAVACFSAGRRLLNGEDVDAQTLNLLLCDLAERVNLSSAEGRAAALLMRQMVRKGLENKLLDNVLDSLRSFREGEQPKIVFEVETEKMFCESKS